MITLKYKYNKNCHGVDVATVVNAMPLVSEYINIIDNYDKGYVILKITDTEKAANELRCMINAYSAEEVTLPTTCTGLYNSMLYNWGKFIMACSVIMSDIIRQYDEALYTLNMEEQQV